MPTGGSEERYGIGLLDIVGEFPHVNRRIIWGN
jgi:hypothetical protein